MRLLVWPLVAGFLLAGCASPDTHDTVRPAVSDLHAVSTPPPESHHEAQAPGVGHKAGKSNFRVIGACQAVAQNSCLGDSSWAFGPFKTNATRDGSANATWPTPLGGGAELSVEIVERASGDGVAATIYTIVARGHGASPLHFALPPLESGDYEVGLFPDTAAGAVTYDVSWSLDLPAPRS